MQMLLSPLWSGYVRKTRDVSGRVGNYQSGKLSKSSSIPLGHIAIAIELGHIQIQVEILLQNKLELGY